jgi:hypothetical protein
MERNLMAVCAFKSYTSFGFRFLIMKIPAAAFEGWHGRKPLHLYNRILPAFFLLLVINAFRAELFCIALDGLQGTA